MPLCCPHVVYGQIGLFLREIRRPERVCPVEDDVGVHPTKCGHVEDVRGDVNVGAEEIGRVFYPPCGMGQVGLAPGGGVGHDDEDGLCGGRRWVDAINVELIYRI